MRILKPGEPCPCCGKPMRDDLPRWKLLLLSYIAEGLSLMDAINALAEVMDLPQPDKAEALEEVIVSDPRSDAPAPTSSEAEEKRAILQRLKEYRSAHGRGCLDAVAKATRSRGRINDNTLRMLLTGDTQLPIADWRKIGRALDRLEAAREAADG